MNSHRVQAAADVDLAIMGSGCSSTLTPSSVGSGSDARVLAMLRRQLHGPKRVSLKTEECPAKLQFHADLVEAGDLSALLPLAALDQYCFDELAAVSLAVATRAVPPEALRGVAALAGIRGIEVLHRHKSSSGGIFVMSSFPSEQATEMSAADKKAWFAGLLSLCG